MKRLMLLKHTALRYVRSLYYMRKSLAHLPRRRIMDIPYYPQWESAGLVEAIIKGELHAEDDPLWRRSGAKTKKEYTTWSWSACGLACTKMILAHATHRVIPIVQLGKNALRYGCYDEPLETSVGLKYRPYITFLYKEFGMRARIVSPMMIEDILLALSEGRYVIASVSPEIRQPKQPATKRGGHLVLIVGYDLDKKEVYINNPSGFANVSQDHMPVSFADFKRFSSFRGIVVETTHGTEGHD